MSTCWRLQTKHGRVLTLLSAIPPASFKKVDFILFVIFFIGGMGYVCVYVCVYGIWLNKWEGQQEIKSALPHETHTEESGWQDLWLSGQNDSEGDRESHQTTLGPDCECLIPGKEGEHVVLCSVLLTSVK